MYANIREWLAIPFGWALHFLYSINISYIISLVLITLVVRLALLPTSIKQQKNSAKQMRLQAKANKIKQKYAGNNSRENQAKIQEETQELYRREGFNPSTQGCLPMVITLVVMMGLYGAIYSPISRVLNIKGEQLAALESAYYLVDSDYDKAVSALTDEGITVEDGWQSSVAATATNAEETTESSSSKSSSSSTDYRIQLDILNHFTEVRTVIEQDATLSGIVTAETLDDIQVFIKDFQILGVDLTATPKEDHSANGITATTLIPILAGISTLLTSLYTYIRQRKTNPEMAKNPAMGCMTFMSPAISVWFAWTLPAGIGFYWIISGILSFIQTVALGQWLKPPVVIAGQMIDETVTRRAREKSIKERRELVARHSEKE